MIVNSSRKLSIIYSSNVKDISSQKKRKLIINSNESLKKTKKAKTISFKKVSKDGMTKILLIVDGWDIDVDDVYVNSLLSKINDVKNEIGSSNDDSDNNSNDPNFSFVDKSNTRDRNLTLRLKCLGERQVEKDSFIEVVS